MNGRKMRTLVLAALLLSLASSLVARAETNNRPNCRSVVFVGDHWWIAIQANYSNKTVQWGYQSSVSGSSTSDFFPVVTISKVKQNGPSPKIGYPDDYLYHSSIGNPYSTVGGGKRVLVTGDLIEIRMTQTFGTSYLQTGKPINAYAVCVYDPTG